MQPTPVSQEGWQMIKPSNRTKLWVMGEKKMNGASRGNSMKKENQTAFIDTKKSL